MLRLNNGAELKTGITYIYQGKEYKIEDKLFKVKAIKDLEKQIQLDLIDESMKLYNSNFWKSDYGKDPNIYLDGDKYKLCDIKENDIIKMVGFEYDFKGNAQFNPIGGYVLSDSQFTITSQIDKDKLIRIIDALIGLIKDDKLRLSCIKCIDTYRDDFIKKPAAHSHHHNYVGGLLQHTAEVMLFAYSSAKSINCNTDVVITASLFHDIMKIKEYSDEGDYLPYGTEIGHVVGSAMVFEKISTECGVDSFIVKKVVHCILSHHGRKEWGSPVEPSTPEAVIVHNADMVSASINPMFVQIEPERLKDYYVL